jgi:hypothetical protein
LCDRRDLRIRDRGSWAGEDHVHDEAIGDERDGLVLARRGWPDDVAKRDWAEELAAQGLGRRHGADR